jgi:hexulose-6-phosphate isomerase
MRKTQHSSCRRDLLLGVTQYTCRKSGKELVPRAKELGFQGAEPMIADKASEYLSWSDAEICSFRTQAGMQGIAIPTTAVAIFNDDSALINRDGESQAVEVIRRCVEFTSKVGAGVMLLCTFFASHPDTPEKQCQMVKVLRKVLPVAQSHKVKIALESPLPACELVKLVDSVKSDFLGVYYDVGNALYLGFDPAEEIEILNQRIFSVHLKDTLKILGDSHLGLGRLNMASAMASLNRTGYKNWLILETPGDEDTAIQNDIAIIRQTTKGDL